MPTAVFALVIVFVISFVLRLPIDRTIVASALAAGTVFSGFLLGRLPNLILFSHSQQIQQKQSKACFINATSRLYYLINSSASLVVAERL